MRSTLPKVLHTLGGRPLLAYVLDTAERLQPAATHVVYGHGGEQVPSIMAAYPAEWVLQAPQNGTGHAVQQALPAIDDAATVLVLYGDTPFISPATLIPLVQTAADRLALLTAELDDPAGYGRIVRGADGAIQAIVEHKDASEKQREIREINTGVLAAPARLLRGWLDRVGNDNTQGEYYLTDIIGLAVQDGVAVTATRPGSVWEILGINSKAELARMERHLQNEQAQELMAQGVTVRDPQRLDIRGEVIAGRDVEIDVNVILEGKVKLGDGVRIGANCIIRDTEIGDNTEIKPNSMIEESVIGNGCRVGPFARLRPGTRLDDKAQIGNFVEVKKSHIGTGTKVNHLSYIGDTTIGSNTNIGAGVITCNYDGANKHQTTIGDNVFVGSDVQLIAPVKVGDNATIGAGSTINRDVPAEDLTLSRVPQKTVAGWERPRKKSET